MKIKYYTIVLNVLILLFVSCSDEGSPIGNQSILGCMDDLYDEYNSQATENDNSCFTKSSISYNDDIKSILDVNCTGCHNDGYTEGGLNLSLFNQIMEGGVSGDAVIAGDHQSSILYDRITRDLSEAGVMPPNGSLDFENILLIKRWIDRGAQEND